MIFFMSRTYNTFRLSDSNLLKALAAIANSLNVSDGRLEVRIDEQHQNPISCQIGKYTENPEIKKILNSTDSIIGVFTLQLTGEYRSNLKVKRENVIDSVTCNMPNEISFPLSMHIMHTVQTELKPFERDESFDKLLGNELSEFYRKREQSLVRLEDIIQRSIEQQMEYKRKLDQETQSEQKKIQEKFDARVKEIETEYTKKSDILKKQEENLNLKLKEIDDRSSKHARRQIRQDLKSAIAQRGKEFTLTKKTTQKRLIIHIVFCSLIILLSCLLIFCLMHQISAQGVIGWINLIRFPILSIGLIAIFIYYIRWNDNWFRRHADEEFRIKRFELDVDRASWLVEMAMEWKDEKGNEIPQELIDRLSVNLFDKDSDTSVPKHPSEDMLSALLAASAELNLQIPGLGTVRLDRKGAKQFQQSLEKSE